MQNAIQKQLKQTQPFHSLAEEVFVGIQILADRLMEPWSQTLRETADLSHVQYNVLRILRGAGKAGLGAGEISDRLITRSPDVTRLVDRLVQRGLVARSRDESDRRAVRIHITSDGLERLALLDEQSWHPSLLSSAFERVGEERMTQLRDIVNEALDALDDSRRSNNTSGKGS
jgi:DNA-binding MarR family transcriptional regulator